MRLARIVWLLSVVVPLAASAEQSAEESPCETGAGGLTAGG